MAIASDFANLWAWYDARTGGWGDQSGNGRDATLPGGSHNPTIASGVALGSDAFLFTGSAQQYVTLPSMAALTKGEVYLVIRLQNDPPPSPSLVGLWDQGFGNSSNWVSFPYTSSHIFDSWGSSVVRDLGTSHPSLTNRFRVYNVRSDAGLWVAGFDGQAIFSTATNTTQFIATPSLGRSVPTASAPSWLDGWIAQYFVYSAIRTDAERAALIGSLITTYALRSLIASQLIQVSSAGGTGGTGGGPGGLGDTAGGAAWMHRKG